MGIVPRKCLAFKGFTIIYTDSEAGREVKTTKEDPIQRYIGASFSAYNGKR
jgi:hypothetical protein